MPLLLNLRKKPLYSGGGWMGRRGGQYVLEKKKIYYLCQESNPNYSSVQPVACHGINQAVTAPIHKMVRVKFVAEIVGFCPSPFTYI
jgi:hypothetical protein